MKIVLVCPTVTQPYPELLAAIRAEIPLLDAAEIEHGLLWAVGSPYISHARSKLLREALDLKPDAVVFLDHDMSWAPGELLRLIQTPGEVVAGTYRFKKADEEYMGTWKRGPHGSPLVRDDGCILAEWVPAGFLKVTTEAVRTFARRYPELCYGDPLSPHIDLFNHGARNGRWFGEDYAFSDRWNEAGGEIWIIPDLKLTHHAADGSAYPGDFETYLRRQPGGDLHQEAEHGC